MNCVSCSAPLSVQSDVCEYCGTRNDTDLRRLYHASVTDDRPSERQCPRCLQPLRCLRVDLGTPFELERCEKCLGIFFDTDELEAVLQASLQTRPVEDRERLGIVLEESQEDEWPTVYIPCPACGELMLRKAYGARSGVISDWCKKHGVWLDGGELGKLLRWARAGGLQKTARMQEDRRAEEEARKRGSSALAPPLPQIDMGSPLFPARSTSAPGDLLSGLFALFRGTD